LADGLRSKKRNRLKPQWSQPRKRVISFFIKRGLSSITSPFGKGLSPKLSLLTPGRLGKITTLISLSPPRERVGVRGNKTAPQAFRVRNRIRFVPD
jgi:hypothetical protein